MATEKELKVKITANSQQFLSSVKGVNSSLDGLIANFSKFNLSTVGAVAALGTLVAGFSKIVKSTANYGDELNKTSQKIGISVEALSGLNYAAKLSDVTNEQLATGLKKLSVNVVDAGRGVGDAKDAFNALGIVARDSNGDMQASDVILLQVAERFKNMEDGIGKTALAVKIFGKAGADLIPLLNQGASGIKSVTDEAKAFGLVIDKEAAMAAEEFNDNITRMTELISGVVYSIGNAVIPAINDLTTAWINYSKEVSKTPSVWEDMWSKISPSADMQKKLGGIGIFKGGELLIGEGVGGALPPGKWISGTGEKQKDKVKAPELVDDVAGKALKAAEAAAQKTKEWQFQMRAEGAQREQESHDKEIQDWIDKENERWGWEQATADQRIALEEKVAAAKIASQQRQQEVVVGSLAFIGRSALAQHKAGFAIQKAANISMAFMDTKKAAVQAYRDVPYPYNIVLSAMIAAAGMANVAAIASTSFGGKGSGSGGGAAASATSGAGVGGQGSTFVANQQPRSVQVVVHGNIIDHAAFVRELQPYFREVAIDTV